MMVLIGLSRPNFYPRPPRGGRPGYFTQHTDANPKFLSTPSARRATHGWKYMTRLYVISIHALREEGDPPGSSWLLQRRRFLSTPSAHTGTI